MIITIVMSWKPESWSSCSPPISRWYPGGSDFCSFVRPGIADASSSEGSRSAEGNAPTVIVRNWLRRCSFSVRMS